MGERNQVKWIGVRPTEPPESLPVYVKPPTGLIAVNRSTDTNTAGIHALYVVPDGKTFFLSGVVLTCGGLQSADMESDIQVRDASDNLQYRLAKTRQYYAGPMVISRLMWPPKEIPEKYDIVLWLSGAAGTTAIIDGWLE